MTRVVLAATNRAASRAARQPAPEAVTIETVSPDGIPGLNQGDKSAF